jgi:NADH-quinone oxidoreductase subunit J
MFNLFNYFIILQVFTSTFIYFSINPIHSILLLILLFFESSIVLSLFNLEFISILFILIYVGAIAILFIFVIMMLQLKLNDLEILFIVPLIFSFNFLCFLSFFNNYQIFYIFFDFFNYNIFEEIFVEIFILGQVLYNYSLICFLLSGLILLLALIGSIILSLEFYKIKFNFIFKKLGRSSNFISFFK